MKKIKDYIIHNYQFILSILIIIALCDNFASLTIKLILEAVICAILWVIIIAIDFVKEMFNSNDEKIVKNKNQSSDIDRRPIIEQLNEAYGNAQERRRK